MCVCILQRHTMFSLFIFIFLVLLLTRVRHCHIFFLILVCTHTKNRYTLWIIYILYYFFSCTIFNIHLIYSHFIYEIDLQSGYDYCLCLIESFKLFLFTKSLKLNQMKTNLQKFLIFRYRLIHSLVESKTT